MPADRNENQHRLGYLDRQWLMRTLASVYTSEGVHIWLTAEHKQFGGLTVDEMVAAGRKDEVLAVAEALTGQVAT
jgi:hypothetical protein